MNFNTDSYVLDVLEYWNACKYRMTEFDKRFILKFASVDRLIELVKNEHNILTQSSLINYIKTLTNE